MLFVALLVQAAAPPADIQLDIRATVREVRIEQDGEASLLLRGGPDSDVTVEAPEADGRRRLRDVEVRVRAEARIADPRQPERRQEPLSPD